MKSCINNIKKKKLIQLNKVCPKPSRATQRALYQVLHLKWSVKAGHTNAS